MKTEIETTIKKLVERAKNTTQSDEALRFTQAALNLAHTLSIIKAT